jgi:hypothetical protein
MNASERASLHRLSCMEQNYGCPVHSWTTTTSCVQANSNQVGRSHVSLSFRNSMSLFLILQCLQYKAQRRLEVRQQNREPSTVSSACHVLLISQTPSLHKTTFNSNNACWNPYQAHMPVQVGQHSCPAGQVTHRYYGSSRSVPVDNGGSLQPHVPYVFRRRAPEAEHSKYSCLVSRLG